MPAAQITAYRWLPILDGDPRGRALYQRHYSCTNLSPANGQWMPPGEKMALLTVECDALFGWLHNTTPRYDKQEGVNCTVFRNESRHLSSDLIREADEIAWEKWPDVDRHFTYVDEGKTAKHRGKRNAAGWCFIKAGWQECGRSKSGLILLERLP